MRFPMFAALERQRRAGETTCWSYARGMHPNPRFYKYAWWIFHHDSPCDGAALLTEAYRLSTAAAFLLMARLRQDGEPFWLYNRQVPRHDPPYTPWDPQAPLWAGMAWAPAYDLDTDPVYKGHK